MSDTNPFFRRYIIAGLLVGAAALSVLSATIEDGKSDTRVAENELGQENKDKDEVEKVFGIEIESMPVAITLGVLSVGLAFMVVTKWGNPILALVILFAFALLLLDLREVVYEIGKTNWKLAGLAIAAGVAHFGAIALSFRGRVSGN